MCFCVYISIFYLFVVCSPRHTIEVLTTYLLQFFYLLFILCFVLFYIETFILTNTVRTKVAKTAKSELRFCLFILLFPLPQLVGIRNEDLQTNHDRINFNKRLWYAGYYPTWWNYVSTNSGFRQTTTTPSSGAILWVSWFAGFPPGDNRTLVDTAGRYCRPIATA